MQPYYYVPYLNSDGATMPNRYMVPANYQEYSAPFVNQSFDPYAGMPRVVRPTHYVPVPMGYPLGYRPGYPAPGLPPAPGPTMIPVVAPPQPQYGNQSQPIHPTQPYYYNPNVSTGGHPGMSPRLNPPTTASKNTAKQYTNNTLTVPSDGSHDQAIKGLVTNNDLNALLKQKGTKVKVSKIYRITKQKPDRRDNESTDDVYEPVSLESARPRTIQQPPLPPPPSGHVQRPPSASSGGSHCSKCSNCSCAECRSQGQRHTYDDCPQCRAEREQEQAKLYKRK